MTSTPSTDESPGGGRLFAGILAAAVVVAVAATALLLSRSVDAEPVTVEHQFPADSEEPVWFRVEASDDDAREVTATWARLTTSVTHESDEPVTYSFVLGVGRPDPLVVTVDPGAEVVFGSGPIEGTSYDLGAEPWTEVAADPDPDVVAPLPLPDGSGVEMSVDEAYSYGLVVEGVGLRGGPDYVSGKVATIFHGDRLRVTCYVEAEEVTNGNNADPSDDATQYWSEIWWYVDDEEAELPGYVSDVWLGRTDGVLFGLPECPAP